jgi:hypothetical protein
MRVFGPMFFLLSLPLLAGTEITTKIHDIDYGQKPGDEVLLLLSSGDVAKLTHSSAMMIQNSRSKSKGNWYNFKLDDNRYVTDFEEVDAPFDVSRKHTSTEKELNNYVPTTIASMDIAKKYHREGRLNSKDSQCFNRAMVWTYEWWQKHSLRSNKLLIYFTRTYIRRYNFEWWFHIAPYVHVMHEGKVVERMMDIKYTRGPLEIPKWTNIFMRNDAPCRVITKYSDYADYPYTGECYIQRTNMYTYQPADLQMNEAWGYTKTSFNMDEVRGAYLEAFDERL